MPSYKNKFAGPDHYEHVILNDEGKKLGTLRVKPSGVLWKPVDKQKFFSVTLEQFTAWIADAATRAKVVKK